MPTYHQKTFAEKLSNGVHHLGEMLLIPAYDTLDALDSYFPDHDREIHAGAGNHNSLEHGQQQMSLSRRIGNGMHHVGDMLCIPTYEAIDACAQVPHQNQPDQTFEQKSKMSGNIHKICRTVGAMLSVPIYEAAEMYGKGPQRGH